MHYFVRGLAQRQLAQSHQRRFPEKVLHRLFGLLAAINHAARETVEQRPRCQIDHDHFIGLLHYPIGNRLAHADSGDLVHLVVQALQVLDVHGGEHVDSGFQENLHVFPTFGAGRSGHVRVRELVDRAALRAARQNGIDIHLFKRGATVLDFLSRNDLQAFCFQDRVLAAVRLEVAHYHIHALSFQFPGFHQHLVGFADPGGVAHVNFQTAPPCIRHALSFRPCAPGYCGNTRTSMPRAPRRSLSTGLPQTPEPSPERWLWPMKIWVMPPCVAKSRIDCTGSSPSKMTMRAPAARANSSFSSRAALSAAEMRGCFTYATSSSP